MNVRRCQRTAERIRLQFDAHLGIVIDTARMLTDAAYADDVLTVCDARPDTELAELARHYRLALAELPSQEPTPSPGLGAPSTQAPWPTAQRHFHSSLPPGPPSEFTASRPQVSAFEQQRQAARAARKAPGWMTPGRWLGHDT
jgi:hypothetical protein